MELQMRELKALDTFKVLALISKLGAKELIEQMFDGSQEATNVENLVETKGQKLLTHLFDMILTKLPFVETELNSFLAELCSVDLVTIQELPFLDYMTLVRQFLAKSEFKDFLKFISLSTK